MKVGELFWELGLDMGMFDKELDESDRKAQSVSSGVEQTFKRAALGIAAAAGLGFHQWHEGFEAIRTQTGAEGEELEGLMVVLRNVSGQVKASLGDIGQVLGFVHVKTGLVGDELEDLTVRAIKLAEVTGGDVNGTVRTAVKLFTSWEVATNDQAAALELLYAAYQKTGVGIEEIAGNSLRARTLLQGLGMDFEDSIALAAKLGSAFPQVFAGLRIALATLSKDPSVKNIPAAFREMVEEIDNAGSSASANRKAIELFGSRAGPFLATAIREGKLELSDFLTELRNSHDTIGQAHDDVLTLIDRFRMVGKYFTAAVGPALQWGSAIATIASGTAPLIRGVTMAAGAVGGLTLSSITNSTAVVTMGVAWLGLVAIAGSVAAAIGVMTLAIGAVTLAVAAAVIGFKVWQDNQRAHQESVDASSSLLKAYAVNVATGTHSLEDWRNQIRATLADESLSIQEKAKLAAEADRLTDAINDGTLAAEGEEKAQEGLAKRHREAASAAREQWTAELQLAGGMLGVEAAALGRRDAMDRVIEVQTKLNRLEANGKEDTKKYAATQRELREANLGALQAALGLEESVRSYVEELRHGGSSRKEAIDEIREFGRQTGVSRDEVNEIIGRIDWLKGRLNEIKSPPPIDIKITNMDRAMAMVDGFIGALGAIPGAIAVNAPVPSAYAPNHMMGPSAPARSPFAPRPTQGPPSPPPPTVGPRTPRGRRDGGNIIINNAGEPVDSPRTIRRLKDRMRRHDVLLGNY